MTPANDFPKEDPVRSAVTIGAEIVGWSAGNALGFLFGGPVGSAAGGAAGVIISRSLVAAGAEVCERILSPREKARVGAALAVAAERTQERLANGDHVREDGFFSDGTDRPPIEEVTEGLLLAAQRAYDEKKVQYIGRMSANLNFRPDLNVQSASVLVRFADQLSYQQMCLLRLCQDNATGRQLKAGKADQQVKSPAHGALLSDLLELERLGFINNGGTAVLGLSDVDPPAMRLQLFGIHLYSLMELGNIPDEDIDALRATLEAPEPQYIKTRPAEMEGNEHLSFGPNNLSESPTSQLTTVRTLPNGAI